MNVWKWIIVAVAAVLVICMLVWVRGTEHHRGDDVGSLGPVSAAAGG